VIPLPEAEEGQELEVVSIAGGRGARERLLTLGIMPGRKILLINRGDGGPVTIGIGASRFALGRGIAEKLLVRG